MQSTQLTPGLDNSQAAATPGRNIVMDQSQWTEIEAHVKDIVSLYGTDERILLWDLYNEPGSYSIF